MTGVIPLRYVNSFGPQIFAISLAFVLVIIGAALVAPQIREAFARPAVVPADTSPSSLKVIGEGSGEDVPTSSGSRLQGATSVPQSGEVGENLQKPGQVDNLQPNAGHDNFQKFN